MNVQAKILPEPKSYPSSAMILMDIYVWLSSVFFMTEDSPQHYLEGSVKLHFKMAAGKLFVTDCVLLCYKTLFTTAIVRLRNHSLLSPVLKIKSDF